MKKLTEKELNELTKEELVCRCVELSKELESEKNMGEIYKRESDLYCAIKTIVKCAR